MTNEEYQQNVFDKGHLLAEEFLRETVKNSTSQNDMNFRMAVAEQMAISVLAMMAYNHQVQGGILNGEFLKEVQDRIFHDLSLIEEHPDEIRMLTPGDDV